jgi:citrate lyase subunit beta/citryl-CoA lyase
MEGGRWGTFTFIHRHNIEAMPHHSTSLRRSVLYVPASNERAMAKSWTLEADTVILDLEDAVAPAAKEEARECLVRHLGHGRPSGIEVVVRVNALGTSDFEADLRAVKRARPDAVLLPKLGNPDVLHDFAAQAAAVGLPEALSVWAMVETPAGILELDAIVLAGKRPAWGLDCLVVGTNDIAKETGVFPGEHRQFLMPWLMGIVLVAKRRGLSVLDGVWNDFRDQDGFEAETIQAMKMGFDGKTLIHPTQVASCNRILSPSPEAVDVARRIVDIFSDPAHANANVVNMGGRMVERLHYEQSLLLIEKHARASRRSRNTGSGLPTWVAWAT